MLYFAEALRVSYSLSFRVRSMFVALAFLICFSVNVHAGYLYALNSNSTANQIYGFNVNESTGALTSLAGFPVDTGSSGGSCNICNEQLTIDRTNNRLFAINDASNTVSAYSINPTTGALTALPFSPITLPGRNGTAYATMAVHPSGSPLVISNPNLGAFSYNITATTATAAAGSPYLLSATVIGSVFSRDGNSFYAGGGGAGINTFNGFSVNAASGVLTSLTGSPFDSGNSSPRAYATDSQGRIFLANLNAGQVRAFTTASGIPSAVTGNPFTSGLALAVDGVLSPNEQFYVVADRGGNQVASFQIAGTGASTTLTGVGSAASGGTATNALVFNSNGSFLFASNRDSRNITTYNFDSASGALSSNNIQAADTLGTTGFLSGIDYLPATNTAANLIVTRTDDRNNSTCVPGDCSLREAVKDALAAPTDDTISFAAGLTTITLTGQIATNTSGTLTINGPGANVLTIDGGTGTNRIFSGNGGTVTIRGVTLTGGNGFGAAVDTVGGTLVLEEVVVQNNVGTSVSFGAIYIDGGTNHRISNSTISGNTGFKDCPAILSNTSITVVNTTISGNSTDANAGGIGAGAVCLNSSAVGTFRNTTISGNSGNGTGGLGGGGIFIATGATVNLGNTIVAGNTSAGSGPDLYRQNGTTTFTTAGGNLIGDNSGNPSAPNTDTFPTGNPNANGDKVGTAGSVIDPMLGTLTIANGGTTPTHALLAGSPAIDMGINSLATAAGLTTDQRGAGFSRIVDGNGDGTATVDVGAYEYQFNNGGNTQPGNNKTVQSSAGNASVTFGVVTSPGTTIFTPINPPSSAGTAPFGYTILNSEPAYDITTTASYTPPVTVCFKVSSINDQATFDRLRILHGEGGGQLIDRTILPPDSPAPDFATRTVCARVNSLSPFVVALAPVGTTAAEVSVSGRVMTSAGQGITGVVITMTDSEGNVRRTVSTTSGYYRFENIEVGSTYIFTASGKRFSFSQPAQMLNINEETEEVNFIANPTKRFRM